MEETLDRVIDCLYEEGIVGRRPVYAADLIVALGRRYRLTVTEPEISYLLEYLEHENLVRSDKSTAPPSYALSVKGIVWKKTGGLTQKLLFEKAKSRLAGLLAIALYSMIIYFIIEIAKYAIERLFVLTPQ